MDAAIVSRIASELQAPVEAVGACVDLFEKGATAPFLSQYRKEVTGGLAAATIRAVQERLTYYREVLDRRASLTKLLTEHGKLTDALQQRIQSSFSKVEIEDLFQMVRPKKKSRAADAIQKGLEPLADYIWNQEADAWSLEEHVSVCVDPEKKVSTREEALQGAADIMAEWISDDLDHRTALREMLWNDGAVVSSVVPAKANQKTKYVMYYDRREPVATIPSHRVLAIRRGTKEGILTSAIEGDVAKAVEHLLAAVIRDRTSDFAPVLESAVRDSYQRILRPLIETEVRSMLKERADREAIRVFQENLANLLLSPPGGPMVVLGMDPGKGEEYRLAVVNESGQFAEEASISPGPPKNDGEGAKSTLLGIIAKHAVKAIAFGSGPREREMENQIRQILGEEAGNLILATVNDAGLSIYVSSRIAREELPDLTASARAAVSLARRLQDPLPNW